MTQRFWQWLHALSSKHLSQDAHVHGPNAIQAMTQKLKGKSIAAMPNGSIIVVPTEGDTKQ